MPESHIRRGADGAVVLDLAAEERALLRELAADLRLLLQEEPADPALRRLFPRLTTTRRSSAASAN